MYYKLIETTKFDSNAELFTSKSIVCVIMVNDKLDNKNRFKKFVQEGIIRMSNTAKVEEATEDEYYNFTKNMFI